MYYLTGWCPPVQFEDVEQLLLEVGPVGDHPAGFGAASGAGVDQDGFLDAGQLCEEFTNAEGESVAGGVAAHQVGDHQRQDAVEDMHADVVVGEVVHR